MSARLRGRESTLFSIIKKREKVFIKHLYIFNLHTPSTPKKETFMLQVKDEYN